MQQSDLDFLNSLSLSSTPSRPAATDTNTDTTTVNPISTVLSPFSDLPTDENGELDLSALQDSDVDDLLRRMDEAESAADGLEGRLDSLLGTLDGMLGALGVNPSDVIVEEEEEEDEGRDGKIEDKGDAPSQENKVAVGKEPVTAIVNGSSGGKE
ncbi:hypothetical protein T439DRAFT_164850 [Meredithblackwellia eburnea MCA 4105]